MRYPIRFSKNKILQHHYEECRAAAADLASEFYFTDRDGSRKPRRGAGHRMAYWNGRSGLKGLARGMAGTMHRAAWMAGRDDLRNFGPVEGSEYKLSTAKPAQSNCATTA